MAENILRKSLEKLSLPCDEIPDQNLMVISCESVRAIAHDHKLSIRDVEISSLEYGLVPIRYLKNIGLLGTSGQAKLLEASVAVVGTGGLGGFVIELLSRMGVGKLVVIDYDSFAESNLNRQIMATENNLGQIKVDAVIERVKEVNSAVEFMTYKTKGQRANFAPMLSGCSLVIDCLDNLSSRYELEETCSELGLIMIHGAIAGFLGQIAVIYPQRPLLASIYGSRSEVNIDRGIETKLGNPAFTPAMLASWQVGEAVKILAALTDLSQNDYLTIIDMFTGNIHRVNLNPFSA